MIVAASDCEIGKLSIVSSGDATRLGQADRICFLLDQRRHCGRLGWRDIRRSRNEQRRNRAASYDPRGERRTTC
jgi:hypothetical protein